MERLEDAQCHSQKFSVLTVALVILAAGSSFAATLVIDSMHYGSNGAAQAAWPGSPSVVATTQGGVQCVEFPCNFTGTAGGDAWNKTVSLNLLPHQYLCFQCEISNPWLIAYETITCWSGTNSISPAIRRHSLVSNAWQTVMMPLSSFNASGTPSWSNITKITVTAWSCTQRLTVGIPD